MCTHVGLEAQGGCTGVAAGAATGQCVSHVYNAIMLFRILYSFKQFINSLSPLTRVDAEQNNLVSYWIELCTFSKLTLADVKDYNIKRDRPLMPESRRISCV